jgi:predicted metal-dependent peptidase
MVIKMSDEEAFVKFTGARMSLMRDNPFFSFLALSTKPKFTEDVERIGISIDGTIWINPEWFAPLPLDVCKTAICHEIGHIITDTFKRGEGKDPKMWNIATDQVFNEILVKNGFKPIPQEIGGWICEKDWFGLTADEVYDILKKQSKGGNGGDGESSFDEILYVDKDGNVSNKDGKTIGKITVKDKDGNERPANGDDIREIAEEWKERVKEAETISREAGKSPMGTDRVIDDLFMPKVSLRALLERFITNEAEEDCWDYPDKKHSTDIMFPSERSEMLKIGIGIDASGSIDEEQLKLIKGSIKSIVSSFDAVQLDVAEFDYGITKTTKITKENIGNFLSEPIKGGGGTSYIEVMDYFKKNHENAVVMITDLYCSEFGEEPNVPVLWLVNTPENWHGKVPYGKICPLR